VRVGIPGQEYPYIEKYENVDQDEVNWVWDTISNYQENFLLGWKRIHGGEWKTGVEPIMMELRTAPKTEYRLRLKPKIKKDRIKEAIGGILDKRFMPLQKRLIWDLDKADFKTIDLVLYLRLGGWSHTRGTYHSFQKKSGMSGRENIVQDKFFQEPQGAPTGDFLYLSRFPQVLVARKQNSFLLFTHQQKRRS